MAEGYEISTEKTRLDLAMVHDFLAHRSYWAKGIPLEIVKRSIDHSLCFGVYCNGQQVGFGRVVTDQATMAYICDVFILEPHRGRGLGRMLIGSIMAHPKLSGLRMWLLGTMDAHGLYERYGFQRLADSPLLERFMVIRDPDAYGKGGTRS